MSSRQRAQHKDQTHLLDYKPLTSYSRKRATCYPLTHVLGLSRSRNTVRCLSVTRGYAKWGKMNDMHMESGGCDGGDVSISVNDLAATGKELLLLV
jgi:hypothetical protein